MADPEPNYSLDHESAFQAMKDAGIWDHPLVVYPPTPKPAPLGDFIGLSTSNGAIAWDFIDRWFNQKDLAGAFHTFVSRTDYFNHNPPPSVGESFDAQLEFERAILPPATRFEFRQVVAQGDLVVLHIEATTAPDQPVDQMVIILRLRDGQVVDSWDLHVPLRPDSNMFARMNRFA